jgi:hypothetical protein
MRVEFEAKLARVGDELVMPLPSVVYQELKWAEGDVMTTVADEAGAVIEIRRTEGKKEPVR